MDAWPAPKPRPRRRLPQLINAPMIMAEIGVQQGTANAILDRCPEVILCRVTRSGSDWASETILGYPAARAV